MLTSVVAESGCSSPGHSDAGAKTCAVGFLGDAGGAPDFDMQVLLADGTVALVKDGGSIPLLLPPQGGRVVFIGVRATNVDGCALQLTGALRDLASGRVSVESRPINLISTGDGWGASAAPPVSISAANFTNIGACPNKWSQTDLYAHTFGLEMTIRDRENRELTKKIEVTPECGEPANLEECLCICRAGYVLGQTCGDGGTE